MVTLPQRVNSIFSKSSLMAIDGGGGGNGGTASPRKSKNTPNTMRNERGRGIYLGAGVAAAQVFDDAVHAVLGCQARTTRAR